MQFELVRKMYANMLFAPLFHSLYPRNKFIIKYPSPQESMLLMLHVVEAYPLFRPQLVAIHELKGIGPTMHKRC